MRLIDLHEAKISGANVGSAMTKIVSYIERSLNIKLQRLGVEDFKNSTEHGKGMRFLEVGTANCLRFNWEGDKSAEIVSVDLWNGTTKDPNFNISFKGTSLAKSLPTLVQVLKAPKLGKMEVKAAAPVEQQEEEPALAEAKTGTHPKHPEATYHKPLSDRRTACFMDDDGEQYYIKRDQLPEDHPNRKHDLDEAKKGEFTESSAIADMIKKLEAGRSFNRSEFVMHYHPENAHAYDVFIEKNKDKLEFNGKRISLPKGQKLSAGKPSKGDDQDLSGEDGGSLVIQRGGRNETYDVPELDRIETEDRVSFTDSLEHLEGLTKGLIRGSFNALFVAGRGGTGKTQTIEDTLATAGLSDGQGYFKITGSASPIGIYTALYKYRDQIVLFDDCDGALESQDGRNIIKAATDTKKIRKLSWGKKSSGMYDPDEEESPAAKAKGAKNAARDDNSIDYDEEDAGDEDVPDTRVPRWFNFTGRVIFISNMSLNKLDPDGALRTRAFVIAIDPTPEEIFQRMGEIVNDIRLEAGSLTDKERQNVLAVVKTSKRAKDASLRTLVRALNLASSGAPHWEKLVQLYA